MYVYKREGAAIAGPATAAVVGSGACVHKAR